MHSDQFACRELQEALCDYRGNSSFTELILPWLSANPEEAVWLREFREREGTPIPPATREDLWRLYAFGRVFEVLALGFQDPTVNWAVSIEEFSQFAKALGIEPILPTPFSPFHHEIVRLETAAEPDQPARVVEFHWPCLMLGKMLFMRAGVTVSAGSDVLAPGIADASTLYWACWRHNRPHQDLSHGWGSNSRWRTDFRRDYHIGAEFHLNVDGRHDLAGLPADSVDQFGLTPAERKELLSHRCFVVTGKDHSDLWPYNDHVRISAE